MIDRFISKSLIRLMKQYPVVTLTGPRQSGKTTLCRYLFSGLDYVNLEDLDSRRFAVEDPRGFLNRYSKGAVLDEIQRTPDLPSYIQGVVDERKKAGLFILTGSQQFEVFNTIRQSLAGRTAVARLLPFALGEIYEGNAPPLEEVIYRGFYPRIHDRQLNPTEALSFYLSTYVERDLRSIVQIRDLSLFERFLKICATQIGQLVNFSQLGNDCGIDQKTVKAWFSLLEASYIVFFLSPHFKNFRKRLVKSPKLYFYDVGFASFLLGLHHRDQVKSHPLCGPLFENFVIAEFLKSRYNTVQENNLYFFRDHLGVEVDLILDYGQELISIEIKSGQTAHPDFTETLERYSRLSRNKSRYVVYGGENEQNFHGIPFVPYRRLDSLLKGLP